MIKCGMYARVSTDLQAEVKNGSLDTQIDLLQKYVAIKNSTSTEEEKKMKQHSYLSMKIGIRQPLWVGSPSQFLWQWLN